MPTKKTTKKSSPTRSASAKKAKAVKKKTARKATPRAAKKTTKKTTKKVASKKTARKTTKKAATSAKKAAAKKSGPPPALPKGRKKTTTRSIVTAPAKKAPPPKRKKAGEYTVDELKEIPTEEIWAFYRKAVKKTPRDEKWLETIRNALMELHYPLVRHIAERLLQTLPKSIELDDLVSAGLFGLMDAIRGFDPDRGIKFKTYCTTRIRGSILDQLRSQDWVPRLVRLKASRIERALQKLQGEYGREPTHAELAENLKLEHGELSKEITSARAKTMFSLSERWDDRDDDGSMEKVEIVEDKTAVDPITELNKRDLMTYVTRSLTHKERFIIEQYYQVGHTMREIGEMLALTESRVCQIHSNVMSRLKALLGPNTTTYIQ